MNSAQRKYGEARSRFREVSQGEHLFPAGRHILTTKLQRADGKIIKPKGWHPPDVDGEIGRQMNKGAWLEQDKEN